MLSNLFNRFSNDLKSTISELENKSTVSQEITMDDKLQKLKTENDRLIQEIQDFQRREEGIETKQEYQEWRNVVEDNELGNGLKRSLQQQLRALVDDNIANRSLYLQKRMTLDKYSQYLTNSNEHLKRQLRSLQDMQYDISTKNRKTEINTRAYEDKRRQINQIMVFFIFAGLAVIPLVAFLAGRLSRGYFGLIVLALLMIYLAYLFYVGDVGSVRSVGEEVIRDFGVLARDLDNGVYVVKQDIANSVFGKSYQVPCMGCPENGKNKPATIGQTSDGSILNYDVINNDNAFYWEDGSAPAYTIVPETKHPCPAQPSQAGLGYGEPAC